MESVLVQLRNGYEKLYASEKKVADYIFSKPNDVIMMNVSELAQKSEVSNATVVRMCQHAGFKGYYQMRLLLSSEIGNKKDKKKIDSDYDPLEYIIEKENLNIKKLGTSDNKKNLCIASEIITAAKTVYVIAVGNTLPIANDLSFRLNRLGIRSFISNVSEQTINYVNNGDERDILIAISKTGMSERVIQVSELAKKRKMKVIAIVGDGKSPLTEQSDCTIITGQTSTLFDNFIHGLETHVNEFIIVDALLYKIDTLREATESITKNEELEIEMSSWKI